MRIDLPVLPFKAGFCGFTCLNHNDGQLILLAKSHTMGVRLDMRLRWEPDRVTFLSFHALRGELSSVLATESQDNGAW